jgi:DNA polymerase
MFSIDSLIGLDFETYGGISLPDHGLERYVKHKTFTPLIASTAEYGPSFRRQRYDFTDPYTYEGEVQLLREAIAERHVVAHNAPFEQAVLSHMGIDLPSSRFIDSAVVARAAGAAGKLEAAAPQLLDVDKMEDGRRLIMLFSVPSKEAREAGDLHFNRQVVEDNPGEWRLFAQYCELDAELGLRLAWEHGLDNGLISPEELRSQAVTMDMNLKGWPVDIDRVEEMQRRYLENQARALENFRKRHGADDLNLASLKQLKEWCLERGIKATSFDEKNVAKLKKRIEKKVDTLSIDDPKFEQYSDVIDLLHTKQILGGSSLKKLQVILDTVGEDGRLHDQYLHIGAGQSWRTTGRSVQMQNLKRLAEPADMDSLDDPDSEWDNDQLAENIRQVFTSSRPDGALIVGDFASVESRGLAWLANAHWKLDAYRQGKDMYKVLAAEKFGVWYDAVTKPQRTFGKVGELSCGYQAGGPAVQAFAANMGVEMNEAEAAQLVYDWRDINAEVVQLWADLDNALLQGFKSTSWGVRVGDDYIATVKHWRTPDTLLRQHPGAQSLCLELVNKKGETVLRRIFHGCYERGRGLCYYKPSQLKSGDLWTNHFTDPKTKQVRFYNIYGGKLAGILTQSFCRELFFQSLRKAYVWTQTQPNVDLIGQFHDEIVLDWWPDANGISLEDAKHTLEIFMSNTEVREFPMEAEIKHDYRYTK